ncbi:fluoride efflux transporter FluC [Sporolactobacillus laevolacticus]|uniref:fluoride efflux transporter FluC n=1 Tax=Sporolactobacillus laevolacticus TaxID=33018 RepID=UPI0025B374B8|nr:CrcB family protein [Sporolactobacillus laevolacticus]MDN3954595.1 CrcB family protein [Sporolactobacillus laevolacticus]
MSYLLLILFGMLGALTRYALECIIQVPPFPFATLLINVIGCFLITFIAQSSRFFRNLPDSWRSLITTGFIGSFTTLSSFLLEVIKLVHSGHILLAALYFSATIISGLAACWLGYLVSHSTLHSEEGA